jgi:SAM-dependent methyltransferase
MNEKGEAGAKPVGTREWYDFIGQLSGALPGLHLGGEEATRTLLEMCRLGASSYVLDVGCGSGYTACLIAERYGSRVLGIDLSEVMVARAEERARRRGLSDRVEFRAADVFGLPFEDDSFDAAIAESVLTPLSGDKRLAVGEMARVIRPGGLIAVNESTFDLSAPPELLALFAEHPAIYGTFAPEMLRDLFEGAGLEVMWMTAVWNVETPSVLKAMGLWGLVSFMVRVYPKILLKLLRDARFRKASVIDDQVTKRGKPYMGYALIVGRKSGAVGR